MGWVEDGETPDDAHGQLTDLEDLVVEGHEEGGQVFSLGQVIVEAVVQALHHAPSASHGLTSLTQLYSVCTFHYQGSAWKSELFANTHSRFESAVLDGILGRLCLAQNT